MNLLFDRYKFIEVDIDDIYVGQPRFQWLLGRLSDEDFRSNHADTYNQLAEDGFHSRGIWLDYLNIKYEPYLSLPLLVEEREVDGYKYHLWDGFHRLAVLAMRKNVKRVEACLWWDGMDKTDWEESKLIQLQFERMVSGVHFPQDGLVWGTPPYDLMMDLDGKEVVVDSFLVATCVRVPYILKRADSFEARGDLFKGRHVPQIELLLGHGKHEAIAKRWGSQPLNTYLVGHFASGPNAERDPVVQQYGRFVRIQQYFRGGFWGQDVLDYPFNGVSTVKEQLIQNEVGLYFLFNLDILKPSTKIYFADQSRLCPGKLETYFKLFQGSNILEDYYRWLPTYLRRHCRNHFNVSVEEVISCIPK